MLYHDLPVEHGDFQRFVSLWHGLFVLEVNNDLSFLHQDAHQTKKQISCCCVSKDAKDWKEPFTNDLFKKIL